MRLRLLSLLLIVKVCRLNTVSPDVRPPLSHWKLTKPLNTREIYQENESLRYQCVDGYVRKAGTSNLIKCKRIGQVLQWTLPTLMCIHGSTGKSSATAIYAGVGGVVVTILLVAAFGVLMFWRRKRMQRLDLSPTPDEIMQMNVVT
uniref:IL15 receptor alpha chain isoform 2 n=1 Tax=Oncorhynchus mykiss TaxID=8022 RepID=Q27T01_ONCMY|nr:IL15 receptor alpha chain isoform 2 [Oncorhynchus mykiss]